MNPSFYLIALLSCGLVTLVRPVGAQGDVLTKAQIDERNAGWQLSVDQLLEAIFKLFERAKALEKLVETLRTRVAFSVTNPKPIEAYSGDVVLKYETVVTDHGANYDTTTGIFTVVTPGLYYFMFFYHTPNRKFEAEGLELQVNGDRKVKSIEQVSGGDYGDSAGNGVILDLAQDDKVQVVLRDKMRIKNDPDHLLNTFTGFLLRPAFDTDPPPPVVCDIGWTEFGDSCYYISVTQKSWHESRAYCQSQGADLVVIKSAEEQAFLNILVGDIRYVWIGLTDSATEGVFKWVDGTPLISTDSITRWRYGEPDDDSITNIGRADCGELNNERWNDEWCLLIGNWICEKDL